MKSTLAPLLKNEDQTTENEEEEEENFVVIVPSGDNSNFVDESSEDDDPLEILDSTLLDMRQGPIADVKVIVIRTIFSFASVQAFFMIIFGYYIYSLGEIVSKYGGGGQSGVIIAWSATFVTIITLYAASNTKAALVLLGLFCIELCIIVGLTSVLLDDLSPIQFSVIVFAQSMCVLGYTFVSSRHISVKTSTIALIIVTTVAWLVGTFAFYEESDWLTAIVLLISLLLVVFYHILQIMHAERYHIQQKLKSIVNFYVDPIDIIYKQLKLLPQRCKCRKTDNINENRKEGNRSEGWAQISRKSTEDLLSEIDIPVDDN